LTKNTIKQIIKIIKWLIKLVCGGPAQAHQHQPLPYAAALPYATVGSHAGQRPGMGSPMLTGAYADPTGFFGGNGGASTGMPPYGPAAYAAYAMAPGAASPTLKVSI
jgi:hypothetical protein